MESPTLSQPTARPIRVVPPVYLLAAVILMLLLHRFAPVRQLIQWPWRWIGVAVIVGGLAFGFSAVALFRRHRTPLRPGQASSSLVDSGPFRVTRNPIYVGMTIALAGVAVLLGSLTPWAVVPLFVLVINRNVIPLEERMLLGAFGEEYTRYQARVRRWI
ncbi:MAG TPA: isoprenylcysteine carboxylmethyltransferase family protein [Tepidisphaeraceae bacterium]|nr:isoprenylcysteine carboxylmethyltransferase family protein [Tepidisphaeraceae bacterium]